MRLSTFALLLLLPLLAAAAPPSLRPSNRQATGGHYVACGPGEGQEALFSCADCEPDAGCLPTCCQAPAAAGQTFVCESGGCCARRIDTGDRGVVLVAEGLAAATYNGGVCGGVAASDICQRCASALVGGNISTPLDCSDAGFDLPKLDGDVAATLSCADVPVDESEGAVEPSPAQEGTAVPATTAATGGMTGAAGATTAVLRKEGAPQPVSVDGKDGKIDDGGRPACFPGGAVVEVEGSGLRAMRDLRVGDRVLVAPGEYSPVFMFTHRLAAEAGEFVEVAATGCVTELRVTPGHFLYVNGALVAAGRVAVGDRVVLRDGRVSEVLGVRRVRDVGLFNPQTLHGDVVVDGVLASTFTQAVDPVVAHVALAPLRAVYAAFGLTSMAFESGAGFAIRLLPRGAVSYS
jgi:Hint module